MRFINAALLAIVLAVLALHWTARGNRNRPHFEFVPEMVHSPAAESFSPNAVFPDGKTLQDSAPGTIPRGRLPLHYQATPEEARRAGDNLENPYSLDDRGALARGAFIYGNFCQACHGPTGAGDGPVAQRGYPPPPAHPPLRKDGEAFHIITYGRANMPSHAAQLSPEDRWKVILFIRSVRPQAEDKAAGGRP